MKIRDFRKLEKPSDYIADAIIQFLLIGSLLGVLFAGCGIS